MVCMSKTSPVCLVYLVSLIQPNKPDRPNRRNEQDRLADFFSILLDQPLASSHFLQFKVSPRCCLRPSSIRTQSRFVIGGWWRTCWPWPHC